MTIVQQIRKRDGRVVPFHENKIADAINKAFAATYKPGYEETAAKLAHEVASVLEVEGKDCPEVEHIQDIVERVLMDNGYVQTAKAYILYRSERSRAREMNTRLMKIYEDITFSSAKDSDIKRENANIDGHHAQVWQRGVQAVLPDVRHEARACPGPRQRGHSHPRHGLCPHGHHHLHPDRPDQAL